MTTYETIAISMGAVGFVCLFIFLGAAFYLAYFKIEMLLGHFQNSPDVTIRRFLLNAGPWGRLHVIGLIMGLMVIPGPSLRQGGVCIEDLKSIPRPLRRAMRLLIFLAWGGLIMVLAMVASVKSGLLS